MGERICLEMVFCRSCWLPRLLYASSAVCCLLSFDRLNNLEASFDRSVPLINYVIGIELDPFSLSLYFYSTDYLYYSYVFWRGPW